MRNLGIDGGLGLGWINASNNVASPFAIGFHGGVPIALAYNQHFTFMVIPEANVGFSSETVKNPGLADTTLSGFVFNVGGRIGAEIQFGFIGIPQLSLQGSVGLLLDVSQRKQTGGGMPDNSVTVTSLTTTLSNAPWGIFTNSLTAIYYM
jgi:hypothetical protein